MPGHIDGRAGSSLRWTPSLLCVSLLALSACADQGVVTGPGDAPSGARQDVGAQVPVDSLALCLQETDVHVTSVDLVTWEEVTLQAHAFDVDGKEVSKFKVDDWEVSEDGVIELRKRPSEDAAERLIERARELQEGYLAG